MDDFLYKSRVVHDKIQIFPHWEMPAKSTFIANKIHPLLDDKICSREMRRESRELFTASIKNRTHVLEV